MKAIVLDSCDGWRLENTISPAEQEYAARPRSAWCSRMELCKLQQDKCPLADSDTRLLKGASGVSCQSSGCGVGTRFSNFSLRPRCGFLRQALAALRVHLPKYVAHFAAAPALREGVLPKSGDGCKSGVLAKLCRSRNGIAGALPALFWKRLL